MSFRPHLLLLAALATVPAVLLGCEDKPQPPQTTSAAAGTAATPAHPSAAATASAAASASAAKLTAPPLPPTPVGLPELEVPADDPLTPAKVALGKQLFFDKRLSKDFTSSCETCHEPEKGWTDGKPLSQKVGGATNTRHSPTLYDVAYGKSFMWDGRTDSLEKTVADAWQAQMGADPPTIAASIAKIPGYAGQFKAIFGGDPTPDTIVKAIASFVRTIRSGGSPWDHFEKGEKRAVGDDVQRGFELFKGKAGCAQCHSGPLYTDDDFHDTGVGFDKPEPDLGRGKVAGDDKLNGAFKTPTLRSVSTHPPYLHDGRALSLEQAVEFMLAGGIKEKNKGLDPKLKPVKLTSKEKDDLLAFLKALDAPAASFERPRLPQ
jgi:cytochrome c peroxidase